MKTIIIKMTPNMKIDALVSSFVLGRVPIACPSISTVGPTLSTLKVACDFSELKTSVEDNSTIDKRNKNSTDNNLLIPHINISI